MEKIRFPPADGSIIAFGAWADNLMSAGQNADDVIFILEDAALHLRARWSLEIKEDSKQCMVARGTDTILRDYF